MTKAPVIAASLLVSCSLATFQSPKTLEPGKAAIGVGVCAPFMPEQFASVNCQLSVTGRYGLIRNIDAGINIYTIGVLADVKYRFCQKPMATFSFGVSYSPPLPLGLYEDEGNISHRGISYRGIYPQLIIGSEYKFAGIKCLCLWENDGYRVERFFMPGIMLGNRVGRKLKYMPEFDGYGLFRDGKIKFGLFTGIGVQYEF
jgi:hypothetical protein